jgi:hypothetical protein
MNLSRASGPRCTGRLDLCGPSPPARSRSCLGITEHATPPNLHLRLCHSWAAELRPDLPSGSGVTGPGRQDYSDPGQAPLRLQD